jgi:hypothetical protein
MLIKVSLGESKVDDGLVGFVTKPQTPWDTKPGQLKQREEEEERVLPMVRGRLRSVTEAVVAAEREKSLLDREMSLSGLTIFMDEGMRCASGVGI